MLLANTLRYLLTNDAVAADDQDRVRGRCHVASEAIAVSESCIERRARNLRALRPRRSAALGRAGLTCLLDT